MTENYCIVEEIVDGHSTYFKHVLSNGDCEFSIGDLIDKPKSLKSKYVKFNYFPHSEVNRYSHSQVNLYIRKEVFYDDNIIDLEPIVLSVEKYPRSFARNSGKTISVKEVEVIKRIYLKIVSLLLPERINPNVIILDQDNYNILRSILTETRFSQLALEVDLQGGI